MIFVVVVVKHINFETLEKLVERKREKNKMQEQKHYILTFEQLFDLNVLKNQRFESY